ncbi:hypothetical protein Enr8_26320 [Blastopirellula retiformator]|uniref:Uncharacterized protein n=1 Tax=Blastopirellula retiformator TaxID=2527970 RepID=A0A5C5V2K1_9BACT|nr:hypothetical protein Enr8_26320 [Blastopirellula retiformator]
MDAQGMVEKSLRSLRCPFFASQSYPGSQSCRRLRFANEIFVVAKRLSAYLIKRKAGLGPDNFLKKK